MNLQYELKTTKSFEEAVSSLKNSLSKHRFGVLWELNFKEKLAEHGLDFDKNFKIFEVCNPKQAQEVLNRHIEVGYFLPCKIVIYEKNDGVFIGMMQPTQLIGMLGQEDLVAIAQDVEGILKQAIEEAV